MQKSTKNGRGARSTPKSGEFGGGCFPTRDSLEVWENASKLTKIKKQKKEWGKEGQFVTEIAQNHIQLHSVTIQLHLNGLKKKGLRKL